MALRVVMLVMDIDDIANKYQEDIDDFYDPPCGGSVILSDEVALHTTNVKVDKVSCVRLWIWWPFETDAAAWFEDNVQSSRLSVWLVSNEL